MAYVEATFGHPQPQSPLRGQDAWLTNDYMIPPNGPLAPMEDHHYYHQYNPTMALMEQRYHQWQQLEQPVPMPHPSYELGIPRSSTFDSYTDSSSSDSISGRASVEPRYEPSYHRNNATISVYRPCAMYASPSPTHASGAECPGVTPQEIQQDPDLMIEPEEPLDLSDSIEIQHQQQPAMLYANSPMDTGLATPASEAPGPNRFDHSQPMDEDTEADDNSGDYSPIRSTRKTRSKKTKASPKVTPAAPLKGKHSKHRVRKSKSKINAASSLASPPPSHKELSPNQCPTCRTEHSSKNALTRHVQTAHARPFACIFDIYGCTATFGAKNEWKRHCSTQHLRLSFYRCDIGTCVPQNATPAKRLAGWDMPVATPSAPGFNDFNRKDLFIQHHRRMHAPEGIDNATPQEKEKFKAVCEKAARRCQVSARKPPPKTICGFCQSKGSPVVFEGASAWETRMEHVGRHLESAKGEHMDWTEDIDLRDWLVQEGLVRQVGKSQWRLTDLIKAEEMKPARC